MKKAHIWVDGSWSESIQYYGSGFLAKIFDDNDNLIEINAKSTKGNNKEYIKHKNVAGEIIAAMMAIDYAWQCGVKEVHLYYDFIGLENWPTCIWQAKTPLSKKYVSKFNEAVLNHSCNFYFHKINAHTDDENGISNKIADSLAREVLLDKNSIVTKILSKDE